MALVNVGRYVTYQYGKLSLLSIVGSDFYDQQEEVAENRLHRY